MRADRLLVHADRDGFGSPGARIRIGERVCAPLGYDSELGFRDVARGHQIEDEERERAGQRADERKVHELCAHGSAERLDVDVVGLGLMGRAHGLGLERGEVP